MKIVYLKGRVKDLSKNVAVFERDQLVNVEEKNLAPVIRNSSSFENKAFYLSLFYDWIIVQDDEDNLCLVPLKKEI